MSVGGEWEHISRSISLHSHSLLFIDLHCFIFGGIEQNNEISNFVYQLDSKNRFVVVNTNGDCLKRAGHLSLLHHRTNRVFMMGGFNDDERALEQVEIFAGREWRNGGKLNTAVSMAAGAINEDVVWIVGGRTENATAARDKSGKHALVQTYDVKSGRSVAVSCQGNQPPPLYGHTATLVGEHLYVFGGWSPNGGKKLDTMYRLHLESGKWQNVPPRGEARPYPVCGHIAAEISPGLLVFHGGSGEGSRLSTALFFNTDTLEWINGEQLGAIADRFVSARSNHAAAVHETNSQMVLYIHGGMEDPTHKNPSGVLGDLSKFEAALEEVREGAASKPWIPWFSNLLGFGGGSHSDEEEEEQDRQSGLGYSDNEDSGGSVRSSSSSRGRGSSSRNRGRRGGNEYYD